MARQLIASNATIKAHRAARDPAVRILRELKPLTGRSAWVFPDVRTNGEPMSENTVNAELRRMGYDRKTLTAQGFRGMA